jgi:hypothetical protein
MSELNAASQSASREPNVDQLQTAKSGEGSSTSPKLTGAALWVAIFAIAVWLGFSIFLIIEAGTNEIEWARITWVFGSIQAIAFAAAGALFGTAVQQQNLDKAQQQATSAKNDADQQREAAVNGRVLAAAIQAEAAAQAAPAEFSAQAWLALPVQGRQTICSSAMPSFLELCSVILASLLRQSLPGDVNM